MQVNPYKIYVDMDAHYDADGNIMPVRMTWEDGSKYEIDQVLDVRRAASMKAGGLGIRYTCRICGHIRYVWLEDSRWFVEGKQI